MNAIPLTFIGCGALISSNPFKCVLMSNQEYKVRPAIVNINSNEPLFYRYSVTQINAVDAAKILMIHSLHYAFLMLFKKMNVKVFNLMSRTNETLFILA